MTSDAGRYWSRWSVVDVPQVSGVEPRHIGSFRYRLTARLCVRALVKNHRRGCSDWPECSSLWRYEVVRAASDDASSQTHDTP